MIDSFNVELVLTRITYSGDNIGRDLEFTITNPLTESVVSARFPHGSTKAFELELLLLRLTRADPVDLDILLTIREADAAFDDRGTYRKTLRIDPNGPQIQPFVFIVSVDESPERSDTKTALFEITCEARMEVLAAVATQNPLQVRPAPSTPVIAFCGNLRIGGENYLTAFTEENERGLLDMFAALESVQAPVQLVLVGNFLELWETQEFYYDYNTTAEKLQICREKLRKIRQRHGNVFDALARFAGDPSREIHYLPGSRDDDLRHRDLQTFLAELTGTPFQFNDRYYLRDFQLFATNGNSLNFFTRSDFFGEKPRARILAENIAIRQQVLFESGIDRPLPLDSFVDARDYSAYLAARIGETTTGPLLEQNQVDTLIQVIRAEGTDLGIEAEVLDHFSDLTTVLGQSNVWMDHLQFSRSRERYEQPIETSDATALLTQASTFDDPIRCAVWGYPYAPRAIDLIPDRLSVWTGSWSRRHFPNTSNFSQPFFLPGNLMALVYQEEDSGSRNRIRLEAFRFPGAVPQGTVSYTLNAP